MEVDLTAPEGNVTAIEKGLAELWRAEKSDGAVVRAALWNVVAHVGEERDLQWATELLGRVAIRVPQRTVILCAERAGPAVLNSTINASCHLEGGSRRVCSEQIVIRAGGERVADAPSLVEALLLPELPVAAWWIGDLPATREAYVRRLLETADRLIIDSFEFDSPDDLRLFAEIAEETHSMPADLVWMRLREWRMAVAALFDPQAMRRRLSAIRTVSIGYGGATGAFGEASEALHLVAWLIAQAKLDESRMEWRLEAEDGREPGCISHVRIGFEDGATASVVSDGEVIRNEGAGMALPLGTVSPCLSRTKEELIVRQLSHRADERLLARTLPVAARLAYAVGR